ncbi:MAG: carbonic anhydrase [Bryobacteraceae bacterium]
MPSTEAALQKVLHFDSPRDNYRCDAAVVWCFDDRFELALKKLLKRSRIEHPDRIRVAGGAKCLASPDRDFEREFVLDQLQKSVRLHGTERTILMVHTDCGAYGGLAAFDGDSRAESSHHMGELRRAANCILERFPAMRVDAYFIDFEGIWQAEELAAAV